MCSICKKFYAVENAMTNDHFWIFVSSQAVRSSHFSKEDSLLDSMQGEEKLVLICFGHPSCEVVEFGVVYHGHMF